VIHVRTRGRLTPMLVVLALAASDQAGAQEADTAATRAANTLRGGSGLVPGVWTHEARVVRDSESAGPAGSSTVTLAEVSFAGSAAWVLVTLHPPAASGTQAVESLYVSHDDQRPLRHFWRAGTSSVSRTFAQDSIRGSYTSPRGTEPVALPNKPQLLGSERQLELVLRAAALAVGWHQTVEVLPLVGRKGQTRRLELAVYGEERIEVLAGEFECWKIAITGPRGVEQLLWVSKERHWVVKSVQPTAIPREVIETVLRSSS
jgi:hypothetical protein